MKVEHSLLKTPRELIERFTNFTELKCSFCSLINSLYFDFYAQRFFEDLIRSQL